MQQGMYIGMTCERPQSGQGRDWGDPQGCLMEGSHASIYTSLLDPSPPTPPSERSTLTPFETVRQGVAINLTIILVISTKLLF